MNQIKFKQNNVPPHQTMPNGKNRSSVLSFAGSCLPKPSVIAMPVRSRQRRGVALVIVLAFVVLLTGLAVAFFSRSIIARQMSNAGINKVKAGLLAQGAVDTVVADLRQEIVDLSNPGLTVNGTTAYYLPKAPINMVPALTANNLPPNILKESTYNVPFYPNAPAALTRAHIPVSTTDKSLNGRVITMGRWNTPLLVASTSWDFTPLPASPPLVTGSFKAPDWILVSRDGSNPASFTAANADASKQNEFVVGRYAYVIYNEGGLLDANVAGYPSVSGSAAAYRNALGFADLTQLPSLTGSSALSQTQVNTLVGWRNFVSAGATIAGANLASGYSFPSGANPYNSYVASGGNGSGFLNVAFAALGSAPKIAESDRMFVSRQDLIHFFLHALTDATGSNRPQVQFALQYLGTFSRDLNQPTISPDPARPKLLAESAGGSALTVGNDDKLNPIFLNVRAPSSYTLVKNRASDGAPSAGPQEPQVKNRFPLNRIAWLTPRGPIANAAGTTLNPNNDPDVAKIVTKLKNAGFTDAFLKQGTDENVKNSFGFTWDDTARRWIYRDTLTTPASIERLDATAHEPDFVQLLKAAYCAGALGKAASKASATGNPAHPYDFQHKIDADLDRQVLQLAANIIDQFDFDGYCTRIAFDNGSTAASNAMEIRGVENYPYLYRVRTGTIVARNALPLNAASGSAPPGDSTQWDSGAGLLLHIPELWNPHDQNAPLGDPRPKNFRIVVDSTDPLSIPDKLSLNRSLARDPSTSDLTKYISMAPYTRNDGNANSGSYSFQAVTTTGASNYNFTTGAKQSGKILSYVAGNAGTSPNRRAIWSGPVTDQAVSSIFTFNIDTSGSTSQLFREPTMLCKVGFPKLNGEDSQFNGPDLSSDPYLGTAALTKTGGPVFQKVGTGGGFVGEGVDPIRPGFPDPANPITGVVAGIIPLRWVEKDKKQYVGDEVELDVPGGQPNSAGTPQAFLTYRIQYPLDSTKTKSTDTWVTYDEKYTELVTDFVIVAVTDKTEQPHGGIIQSAGPYYQWPSYPQYISICKDKDSSNYEHARDPGYAWQNWVDPRTSRFGAITSSHLTSKSSDHSKFPPGTDYPATATSDWLDKGNLILKSNRPDAGKGFSQSPFGRDGSASPPSPSIYPDNFYGKYRNAGFNASSAVDGGNFWSGLLTQNTIASGGDTYFSDADGVVRRGMGGYVTGSPANTTIGLPMATAMSAGTQRESRPYILNRPFRSVAELGYVFSGTPWRNIDFNSPESGGASLLDLFCVADTTSIGSPLVAGKVNLNTRQAPVLSAILAGAYKDETSPGSVAISPAEANNIASDTAIGLLKTTGTAPLMNVSELVGKWKTGSPTSVPIDGTVAFDGMSKNMGTIFGANTSSANIERFRESAIRALSSVGSTRVWNLMVDVIAQTGRYPAGTTDAKKFVVEGEQRYWLHIAIDRYTGEVLDKNLEIVKE